MTTTSPSVRRFLVVVLLTGIILAAFGFAYRLLQILPYPTSSGQSEKSPDGALDASATKFHDEDFWGRSKHWYEFEIRAGSLRQKIVTEPFVEDYDWGSRSDNRVIFWEKDSSSVRFVFPNAEITMKPKDSHWSKIATKDDETSSRQ